MMHSIAAHSMSSSLSLFSLSTWRRASLSVLCFVFRLSAFFISFGNDLVSCFDDFLSRFKHAMLENICLQVSHESFLGWALFCLLWNIATWRTFPFSTQSKSWGKFYTYLNLLFLQMAETSDQNQEMILIKRGLVIPSYYLDISGAGRRYSFLASDSLTLLDVLIKRSIFVINMLIFESKIFHRQFFSKICLSHILPSGHSPVMTLSSQN